MGSHMICAPDFQLRIDSTRQRGRFPDERTRSPDASTVPREPCASTVAEGWLRAGIDRNSHRPRGERLQTSVLAAAELRAEAVGEIPRRRPFGLGESGCARARGRRILWWDDLLATHSSPDRRRDRKGRSFRYPRRARARCPAPASRGRKLDSADDEEAFCRLVIVPGRRSSSRRLSNNPTFAGSARCVIAVSVCGFVKSGTLIASGWKRNRRASPTTAGRGRTEVH